jgi:hypothetical protein
VRDDGPGRPKGKPDRGRRAGPGEQAPPPLVPAEAEPEHHQPAAFSGHAGGPAPKHEALRPAHDQRHALLAEQRDQVLSKVVAVLGAD